MKKMMMVGACVAAGLMIGGCASTGLTQEEQQNVPTALWYDNASLLVEAHDPDLRADCQIGVPALDAVVDTVNEIILQVPEWTIARIEQKHFDNMYMESAKALNGGADGAKLFVKGEGFKTALLLDTFAGEKAHVAEKNALPKDQRGANLAANADVLKAAQAKVPEYVHKHVFPFNTAADDAAREAFFAAPERADWSAKGDEIAAKLTACLAKGGDAAAAKARFAKEMGVSDVDWTAVAGRLQANLEKLAKATQDVVAALQEPTLQQAIAKAAFGGEIVPGVSGKETLAAINRFKDQLATTAKLTKWLIADLAN